MIQSFFVYTLLSILLIILGSIASKRERINNIHHKSTPFWTYEITLSLFLFALISGIRWQVGVDHLAYLENYLNYKNHEIFTNDTEIGFQLISIFFAKYNFHYALYFSFWAFLQIFFIYYSLKNERYLLPFIGLIIIMGPHYLSWMNGIRQMLAATMFVYSIQFLKENKLLKYIVVIGLASLIHKSSILLLILYLIPHKEYFSNRYKSLSLLLITLIIGLNPTWFKNIESLTQIFNHIGYEERVDNLSYYIEFYRQNLNIGPRRISILLSNILVIWYYPKLKKRYKNTNFIIYYNLSFAGILLHNLLSNVGNLFLRPTSYLTIFSIFTMAYLLHYLKPNKIHQITIPFLITLITVISFMILSIIATATESGTDFTNYKFFWDYN